MFLERIVKKMFNLRRNDFDLLDNFDDFWSFPKEKNLMKTDIKEKDNHYLIEVDLPGYDKKEIKIAVEDGYLTINASKSENHEEKEDGHFVRKERYIGKASRSFYVGKDVETEDIKANFKNGTLRLEVPKKDDKKELPSKKYVEIDD